MTPMSLYLNLAPSQTVQFLTFGKLVIYLLKSLGRSATVYTGDCTFTALPIVGKGTVSVYPTDFRCICKRHSYLQRK
jgi:hypothetical protein